MAPTASPYPRRITRSQSREVDNVQPPKNSMSTGVSFGRNWLSRLPEEPLTSSPRNPTPSRGELVPESPENHEGHTNVSGTTLGPYDLEPNPSHVADKIISQLPHVQQEAINILGLVIPQNMKPSILAEEAKRLADSSNPNRKRLRRFVDGMKDELSDLPLVRQGRTFLDISDFRQRLSSAQLELSLPSLHLTNCALLALNIFLPSLGTDDKWQVIQELDSQFPACFMEQLADGTTAGIIGATELHQETFDLALSIRTQFFIMEVERRRDFRNFDPIAILRQIFCMDLIPGADDNDESPTSFRGFNLPGVLQDEDGHLPESLPERFQTAVFERFGDLRDEIYDDGVESLKRLYKLRFFERELVRWIQGRNKEIKEDLKHLTEDQGTRASPYRLASATAGPVNMRQGSVLLTPQKGLPIEPRTKESPQQSRSSQKIRTVDPTPLVQHEPEPEPEIQALRPTVTPQKPSAQVQVQITRTEPERRKSKSHYRNSSAMAALKNRMDNSRQQELSVLESQAPNRSLNAGTMNHGDITEAPTLSQGSPKHEIQQSPDLTYAGLADDSTLHNNDEELDLGRAHESGIMASTSPSASARIVRVSHTPGRFFDSPGNESSYQTAAQRPPARKNFPAGPRFIDAQENRAQVSPISSVYGHSAEKEYAAPSNANQKKRARRPSYSSDISDDGAFEDDDRDVDRRAEKPQQTFPAAKRQRTEAGAGSDSPAQQLQLSLNATRQSQAEATLASEGPDHSTAEQSAGTSRWEAQLKRNASSYTRKANNRWTEEEDERLLMLMAIHGPQWSLIEKEDAICPASEGGPKLEARSQVNLKDRARNLRKKYNREGRELPPGLGKATT